MTAEELDRYRSHRGRSMMDDPARLAGERSVLRWGGLAGILGGIVFIVVFGVVIVYVGTDVPEAKESVERFPDIRAARTVENSLYLVVLVLWVPHFLALYRALRETSLAPALFGSVLSIAGLVVLMAGSLPHVATLPISDRYHAAGTTTEDQATLVLVWEATEGIFDALFVTGLFVVPLGLVALGVAMRATPAFGPGVGWFSVVLGVVGVVAAVVLLADPASPIAFAGVLALILFHLVLGWKVYRLSRTTVSES
jgi:hypothetical protein